MLLRHGTDYVLPDGSKARGILRRERNSSGDPPFGGAPVLPGPNTVSCETRLHVPRGTAPEDNEVIGIDGFGYNVVATRPHADGWDIAELRELGPYHGPALAVRWNGRPLQWNGRQVTWGGVPPVVVRDAALTWNGRPVTWGANA